MQGRTCGARVRALRTIAVIGEGLHNTITLEDARDPAN